MGRALVWFGVVGTAAMLVHYLVVVQLLVPLGLEPLKANVLGFLVAFQVSYFGHRNQTFQADHLPHRRTLPRFFLIGGAGFLLNEALFLLLLRTTSLRYQTALLLVLIIVAMATFVAGRCWAFREEGGEKPDDLCR